MKKLFYILAIVAASSSFLISCTEEEIKPQTEPATGGVGIGNRP